MKTLPVGPDSVAMRDCLGGCAEFDLVLPAGADDTPAGLADRLAELLAERDAILLRADLFALSELAPAFRRALAERLPTHPAAVSCLDGQGCRGSGLAGVVATAVAGVEVTPVEFGGRVVGGRYETDLAVCAVLGDLPGERLDAPPGEQCYQAFGAIETALAGAGFAFTEVVRTWLFANDILAWYGDLNRARTRFFEERSLFGRWVPASTGVGVGNDHGSAMVANALAMKPKSAAAAAEMLVSPLQQPALNYGSAFSRAVEVRHGAARRVIVSGTASIDETGATVHVDQLDAQIDHTMAVVGAILHSRGCDWADVERAVTYLVEPEMVTAFDAYCDRVDLPPFPNVCTKADICRADLLFEIEVAATVRER